MTAEYTPGSQIDHYKIVRKLGHGGMSHVYLASDTDNQQTVVLKFPKGELIGDIAGYKRSKYEAEIGNRLYHPNVQQALNTGEKRSDDYLVIEHIEGRTLRSVLENCRPDPLPPAEALNIVRQICDALAYCHKKGVFHCDIKPENIMVRDDGTVKVIDFGIALLEGTWHITWRGFSGTAGTPFKYRFFHQPPSQRNSLGNAPKKPILERVGTPDYMSPEQLKGKRGTASSDIYAVGVMLYEMLCGHTPFNGENIFAIMYQRLSQDPPSILTMNPKLSSELEAVVMHAIQRNQDKRYKTMKELLHDLENLEEVNAVSYEPEAPQHSKKIAPFSKFSNRSPLALVSLML